MYRYTVLLYKTCTDGLYFCVHNSTLLYNLTLPTNTCGAQTLQRIGGLGKRRCLCYNMEQDFLKILKIKKTVSKLSMDCYIFTVHINCCFVADYQVEDGYKYDLLTFFQVSTGGH